MGSSEWRNKIRTAQGVGTRLLSCGRRREVPSADGYVHMKWAIFTDAAGNRLYASGSLNESRTGLALNAENFDVHGDWHGAVIAGRGVGIGVRCQHKL
jgi:hypothetical protein